MKTTITRYTTITLLALVGFFAIQTTRAQTVLLDPAAAGGFELGTTFAANGWTEIQPGINRQWAVNTAASSVAPGVRSAFIGSNTNNNYNGSNTAIVTHFYRDLVIPGGATNVQLSFYLKEPNIDNTFDFLYVFTTTTASTPVSGTLPGAGYTQRFVNTATAYPAFTAIPSINLTALAGTTVRLVFTFKSDAVTPFANPAVDNISLTYTPPAAACTGTPAPGNTATTVTPVCPTTAFTLSVSNTTPGSGVTYQWQSSVAAGGPWGDIATATNAAYSTTQSSSTYYRLAVTCAATSATGYSTALQVVSNPTINCYCTPTYVYGPDLGDYITNVVLPGECSTLSNNSGTTNPLDNVNYWSSYSATPSNLTTTLKPGNTYTISITNGTDPNQKNTIWIDYNQDGTFAAGELVNTTASTPSFQTNAGSNGMLSYTFTVPVGATLGQTRMRIRGGNDANMNGNFACGSQAANDYGETEDYILTIANGSACTGTPAPGATNSSQLTGVCAADNFTLSVANPSCGSGITYQWQSGTSGTGPWSNIGGATSATLITSQAATTWYRSNVTCSAGGTGTSTPLQVTQGTLSNCFCIPTYSIGNGDDDFIASVTLNTLTNTTGPQSLTAANYSYYTTSAGPNIVTTSLDKGSPYTLTITNSSNMIVDDYFRAWIDYDGNGILANTESIGTVLIATQGGTGTINFTVPVGAIATTARLRIRGGDDVAINAGQSCDASNDVYGEAEDYDITLVDLLPCAGIPAGGTANSSVATSNSGVPFDLSVTGYSSNSGLIFQWQTATAAVGPWSDISGATSVLYTLSQTSPNYYRVVVTCTNSGLSANSTVKFVPNNPYCTVTYVTGTDFGDYISRVRLEDWQSTVLLDNTSTASVSPYYTYFDAVAAPQIIPGSFYWLRVNPGTYTGNVLLQAFIDWNSDGDFSDVGETINWQSGAATNFGASIGGGVTSVGNIYIEVPSIGAGITAGFKRLRIRYYDPVAEGLATPYNSTALSPCTTYEYGETEDYNIELLATPICSTPTAAANVQSFSPTQTVVNDAITMTMGASIIGGLKKFQYSFDNFGTVAGQFVAYNTNTITVIDNVNQPFIYLRAVYQAEGCAVDNSTPIMVKTECASPLANQVSNGDYTTNVTIKDGATTLMSNASTYDATLDGYQNFLGTTVNLDRMKPYTIEITTAGALLERRNVWIDEDGNGIFTASELVYASPSATSGLTTGTFTIPCGSLFSGAVKMRILIKRNATVINTDPCAAVTYNNGEIEEYTVFINPNPSLVVTPSNAVCLGLNNTLTVTGGGSGVGQPNYTWLPVSGLNVATGSTVIATTGGDPEFYTVSGILANGCVSTDIVAVASTPLGGTVAPANKVVCSGSSQVFTVTAAAGDIQWQTSPDGINWSNAGAPDAPATFTLTGITSTTYVRALAKTTSCWDVASTAGVAYVSSTPVLTATATATSVTVSWTPAGANDWSITWTGGGPGGTTANPNNPYTITGLTSNASIGIIIQKTSLPACPGTSNGTLTIKTLCAPPPTVTATPSDTTFPSLQVHRGLLFSWGAIPGATAYMLQYRPLTSSANWTSVLVTGATTKTVRPLIAGVPYAYRVAANNCTANAAQGDFSAIAYAYTNPGGGACTPTPIVTAVSSCPNQITVNISNGGGPWKVTLRRLTPSYTSGVIYTTSTTTTNFNIGAYANSTWEVFAVAVCGAVLSPISNLASVNVKAPCPAPTNVVVSHPTCGGFTVAWNTPASLTACAGIPITGYYVYIKKSTDPGFSAYPAGLADHKTFPYPTLFANVQYDVFVRSVACNGSVSANSPTFQMTPSGPGCRSEETVEEVRNALGDDNESVVLYPNPSTGAFTVDVARTDATEAIVKIEVINALGQVLMTNFSTMSGGNANEYVQVSDNISSGVYMVRVSVNDNTYTQRLVIQKD